MNHFVSNKINVRVNDKFQTSTARNGKNSTLLAVKIMHLDILKVRKLNSIQLQIADMA